MPDEVGRTAQSWLELVDAGEYGRSWETSSAFFRTAVSEASWIASLQAVRKPLGARIHREQISSQEATRLPGVPDGEYRILLFTTEFAGKKPPTKRSPWCGNRTRNGGSQAISSSKPLPPTR